MAEDTATPATNAQSGERQAIEPMSENDAGDFLNQMFEEEAKKSRPLPAKDPKTGKFLKRDQPIPLTPADGSPDPDDDLPENQKPKADTVESEPDAEEPESDDEDEAPAPRTLKVKVDGMEIEVDEEELKKGYSRTADYTRKTQELAEARKKFEAEEVAKYRELTNAYAERLAAVEEALQVLGPQDEPDWNTLRVQLSPEDFTAKFAEYRSHQQRFEKVRGERQRIAEAQQAEYERSRQARIKVEFQKLQEALPDLKDPEKGKTLREDLSAYARSVGYTDDDIAAVEDHRALVLLDKARRYDESQKRKPKIEDKIDRALDTLKPSVTKSKPKVSEVQRLQDSLMKSGSVDDAARLLNTMKF